MKPFFFFLFVVHGAVLYAQTQPNDDELIKKYYKSGLKHFDAFSQDSALHFFRKAKHLIKQPLGKQVRDTALLNVYHGICLHLGKIYYQKGNNKLAIKDLKESLSIAKHMGSEEKTALSLHDLGTTYSQIGDLNQAKKYLQHAISIEYSIGDSVNLARSLNNIGITFFYHSDFETAITYFRESLSIKEVLNHKSIANTLNNIGLALLELQQVDSAGVFFTRALHVSMQGNDSLLLLRAYRNYGQFLLAQKKYDEALRMLNHSLSINRTVYDVTETAKTYLQIASAHSSIGNYALAEQYARQSQSIAIEHNYPIINIEVLNILARNFALQKNYKKAYLLAKEYKIAKDSFASAKDKLKFYELNAVHQAEIKDSKIEHQKALIEFNRNYKKRLQVEIIIYSILSLAAIVLLYYIHNGYKTRRITERKLRSKKKKIEEQKAEITNQMRMLRNQTVEIQSRNEEIRAQKESFELQKADILQQTDILELQQDEIIGSLFYAQKIQKAVFAAFQTHKHSQIEDFLAYAAGDILSSSFVRKIRYIEREVYIIVDSSVPGIISAFNVLHAFTKMEEWLSKVKRFRADEINAHIIQKTKDFLGKEYEKSALVSTLIINPKVGQYDFAGDHKLWKLNRESIDYDSYKDQKYGEIKPNDGFYVMSVACQDNLGEQQTEALFPSLVDKTNAEQKQYLEECFCKKKNVVSTDFFMLGITTNWR